MKKQEIEQILSEGEGYKIEFKETIKNIDKEMVGFANSSGGTIFLGITDNNEIKGIKITNKLKSQIQDIANNCEPAIKISISKCENILIIKIFAGSDKPYKCSSGFYTRVGPNSQKLSRDEIIKFFQSEGKIRFGELVNPQFDFEIHFDHKKFKNYLKLCNITRVLDDFSILRNLGIAEKQEGKVILNNAGILLFSKNLSDIYYHTTVTCALYKGNEKVNILDRRDFNEDIISNIDRSMNFLKQYIPVRYEFTGSTRRKEIPEIPYNALREATINAVIHRDYFQKGANVMIEIFDDRIEISNPGGLIKGLSLKEFGKKSVLRNPNLANLLQRVGYIEKMGTGINKMKKLIADAGLPPVHFEFTDFFTVIFKRKIKLSKTGGVNGGVNGGVFDGINSEMQSRWINILINLNKFKRLNIPQLFEKIDISSRTLERDIKMLKERKFIGFSGSPKKGGYILTSKGKKIIKKAEQERNED